MDVAPISVLRRKIEEVRNKKPAQPKEVVVASISVLRQKVAEAARRHENRLSQPAQPDVEPDVEPEEEEEEEDFPQAEVEEDSDPSLKVRKIL